MSDKWLSAQSFERSLQLVSAINTVSIHCKLEAAGIDDSARLPDVLEARNCLRQFLSAFGPLVRSFRVDSKNIADGVDPRLGELARGFLFAQGQKPSVSALADVSPEEISQLLESSEAREQERLLQCLHDLRLLLEQHLSVDVIEVFGDT